MTGFFFLLFHTFRPHLAVTTSKKKMGRSAISVAPLRHRRRSDARESVVMETTETPQPTCRGLRLDRSPYYPRRRQHYVATLFFYLKYPFYYRVFGVKRSAFHQDRRRGLPGAQPRDGHGTIRSLLALWMLFMLLVLFSLFLPSTTPCSQRRHRLRFS